MLGDRQDTPHQTPAARGRRTRGDWRLATALLGAFLLGGWVLPHLHLEWRSGPEASDAGALWAVSAAPARARALPPPVDEPIARAAAVVSPAVVNIDTVSAAPQVADKDDEDGKDNDDSDNPLLDMLRRRARRPSRGVGAASSLTRRASSSPTTTSSRT